MKPKTTKKFSEIRRPMTPERRARIDAIKAQMDAALDAKADLQEIVAYNGTPPPPVERNPDGEPIGPYTGRTTGLLLNSHPTVDSPIYRKLVKATNAEAAHWMANHDRQVEIKQRVQSMLNELRAAAKEMVRTVDAENEALAGRGHPGEPHNDEWVKMLGADPSTLESENCSACTSAQYGTEIDKAQALETFRAALGEWEPRPTKADVEAMVANGAADVEFTCTSVDMER